MKFFILFLLLSTNAIAKEIKAPVNKTNQKQKTNAAELSLSNDSEDSELDIDEPEPKSVNIPPAREISGIGLGYFFNSKQKHSSISVNDIGTNYSGSLEYEWQSVPEIFAFTHKTPEFGWGYDFMFTYSPTKKLDKATVFLNGYGTFTSAGSSDVKTQSIIVQGNAVYSAGNIYFPFGLNLSANIYENSVSSTASVMSKVGIGGQIGLGIKINNKLMIELQSRAISYDMEFTTITGGNSTVYKFGQGYLSSLVLNLKFPIGN